MLRALGAALVAVLAGSLLSTQAPGLGLPMPPRGAVPMVGFSFSDRAASADGELPAAALRALLRRLQPDLVRLPVYWDEVEPERGLFDFSVLDSLLAQVALSQRTRVVLVAGIRNLGYPEVYAPAWAGYAGSVARLMRSPAYLDYLGTVFQRYRSSRLLYAWQLENEPLDQTNASLGLVWEPYDALADVIQDLRAADPGHPVVVTSYDSASVGLDKRASSRWSWLWSRLPVPQPAGHPLPALSLGDALGLDVYVVTPSTPLGEADALKRIAWKQQAVGYWSEMAARAGKKLWITEMQAAPWLDVAGFTTADLLASARAYAGFGEQVVLLWGVEWWLRSAEWMAAGRQSFALLRGASA